MIEYRPLAFVSPLGNRTEFVYDGQISDSIAHMTSSFKFAGVNGSYRQDKSIDSGDYPFTIILTGDDRVEQLISIRNDFNELGSDDSYAQLQHPDPSLGTFDCVVLGYSVSHNVVRNINVITITVTFARTIPKLTDGGIDFSAQDIFSQNLSIFEQYAQQFSNYVSTVDSAVSALAEDTINKINIATSVFSTITTSVDSVAIAFQDQAAQILSNIDAFVRAPQELAVAMQNLLTLPVLFSDNLLERVNAFNSMIIASITFTTDQLSEIHSASAIGRNYLANSVMVSNAAISGLMQVYSQTESTTLDELKRGTASGFSTRAEIQTAINNIVSKIEIASIELSELSTNYSNINFFKQFFDTSLLIKPLQNSVIENLQNRFTLLPVGRGAVLPYDEHPVVLCAMIYNSVELDVLQFFYNSNNIHGDEYYLLRKGRPLIWYGENIFETEIASYIPIIVEPELDIWQDNPFDDIYEQIQDNPFDGVFEQVQDIPPEN